MTATLSDSTLVVTEPVIYDEMPVEVYHSDPVAGGSLSSSGAKKLLPPSAPAIFAYERENPPAPSDVFEFGHAAHQRVLGVGPELVVVDSETWNTNAVKAEVEAIRGEGKVPLKPSVMEQIDAMEAALRQHPIASALLTDGGHPESSLFWRDEPSGIVRRCRLDWRPAPKTGRTIGVDYKTGRSANPEKFAKSAVDYGYHQQHPWYIDGLIACDLADSDAQFVFIVQEKTPPYLVSVVQLDAAAVRIGRALNRRAIDIYVQCTETGRWPGYSDDVAHVSLPYWYERDFDIV